MDDVAVVEAAEDVQDGVGLADVGQELVAEAFTAGGALHQTRDVHDLHRGGNGALGLANLRQHLQTLVRNGSGTHVGFDRAEREIRALGLWAFPELTQLNKVDFPTLGSPTIPHFKAID